MGKAFRFQPHLLFGHLCASLHPRRIQVGFKYPEPQEPSRETEAFLWQLLFKTEGGRMEGSAGKTEWRQEEGNF